jgi:hypothetical protein
VTRRLGVLAVLGLAAGIAACGGEENELLSEADVRECLADAQIQVRAPGAAAPEPSQYALYLETAPDFTAYAKDGTGVDVVIQGSPERARSTAAHVKGALESLGGSFTGAAGRVVRGENAVAVFHRPSPPAAREAVRGCLRD